MKYAIYTINAVFGNTNSYNYCKTNGTLLLKQENNNSNSSNVSSDYKKYLKPSKNCEVNDYRIQQLSKKFTSNYSSDYEKAVSIFNYLNKITSYKYYSNTRYGAVGTLERGYGNCVDMSHLLIAVMRASGLPARYVHSTSCTFNSGLTVGHVWAEVHVNGKWYTCDLTSSRNKFGSIANWHSAKSITRYISLPF